MFTMVIADDERRIIQLVKRLADLEGLGIEVVGEAIDGLKAYELVNSLKPDILITDIRMPCLDGLELAKRIHENELGTSIVVISGHKQFDYAYNALKYGVEDFLIKPVNKNELNKLLAEICKKREGKAQLRQQLDISSLKLRSRFIEQALSGDPLPYDAEEINREFLFSFSDGMYTGCALKLDFPLQDIGYSAVMEKCRATMVDVLRPGAHDIEALAGDDTLYLLLNAPREYHDKLGRVMKKAFEKLAVELELYGGLCFSIGVGSSTDSASGIGRTLREASLCVRCKCVQGPSRIYFADDLDMNGLEAKISLEARDSLRAIIESGDPSYITQWQKSLFAQPEGYYLQNPVEAVALVDSAFENFFSNCQAMSIHTGKEQKKRWERRLGNAQSFSGLVQALCECMTTVLSEDRNARSQRDSYPVRSAKEYILAHLSEQIKLDDIARSVSLSGSYLSQLFKKETGENISDYVQRLRLDEAKRLLKSTNMTIAEIADNVGYLDAKHFSKLFTKAVGAKPQEYRRLYSW